MARQVLESRVQLSRFLNPVSLRWAGMLVLFIAETEFLLRSPTHFHERTALKAVMGQVPVYHLFLGFVAYAVLFRWLAKDRLPPFSADVPLSRPLLLVHVGYAAALELAMTPAFHSLKANPGWTWLCPPILAGYFGTWLACLLPPRLWWPNLKTHGPWMLVALLASMATEAVARASNLLWDTFTTTAFHCTGHILSLFAETVLVDPAVRHLGTPDFSVTIEPGCSGLAGMGLVACYCMAFLWLRRDTLRFPLAFCLLPLGLTAIWSANILRLTALILIGTHISPEIAMRGFHSQAGWIAFTILGIGVLVGVERFGWFRRRPGAEQTAFPALPLLTPFLVLLFTWMLSQAFSSGFDLYYPLRMALVLAVLLHFAPSYRGLFDSPTPRAFVIGVATYVLWVALVHQEPAAVSPLEELHGPWLALWVTFRIVGSVLIVPLVEELAFRGYLLRRLQAPFFEKVPIGRLTAPALLLSSIAFGLLHQDWLPGVLAGIAYGLALWGRASLSDAVVAHSTTNFCLSVHVLVLQRWGLW